MSIKKITQMTGVSPATVSRVLNNPAYKCSSEQMREKIWKAKFINRWEIRVM